MEVLKVSIDEIVAATGESRSVINDAINAGHLKTFLVGRRRFAKPEAVEAWVDFLEAESDAGRPVVYRPRIFERSQGAYPTADSLQHSGGSSSAGRQPLWHRRGRA